MFVLLAYGARLKKLGLLGWCAAILATVVSQCLWLHTNMLLATTSLLDPESGSVIWGSAAVTLIWIWAVKVLVEWKEYRATCIYLLTCALLSASMFAAAAQVLDHALFEATAFQSILAGLAATKCGMVIRGRYRETRPTTGGMAGSARRGV